MVDLYPISQTLADAALNLGGADIRWYRAIFCPYVRSDGTPCYDERRGTSYIECPVCHGEGVIYASPRTIKGIYEDNSNAFMEDKSGGFMRGEKSLTLPTSLDLHVLKERDTKNPRRLLRDKFEILDRCCGPNGQRRVRETVFLKQDPVKTNVSGGPIYQKVVVINHY